MRIWDIEPERLCRNHLLGEHGELHAIWNILTRNKKGYSNHPETKRWRGKLKALYKRHEALAREMVQRGYKHKSPLDEGLAVGDGCQDSYIDIIPRQREIIRKKKCGCKI